MLKTAHAFYPRVALCGSSSASSSVISHQRYGAFRMSSTIKATDTSPSIINIPIPKIDVPGVSKKRPMSKHSEFEIPTDSHTSPALTPPVKLKRRVKLVRSAASTDPRIFKRFGRNEDAMEDLKSKRTAASKDKQSEAPTDCKDTQSEQQIVPRGYQFCHKFLLKYCSIYNLQDPKLTVKHQIKAKTYEASLQIQGSLLGFGSSSDRVEAKKNSVKDAVKYLKEQDPEMYGVVSLRIKEDRQRNPKPYLDVPLSSQPYLMKLCQSIQNSDMYNSILRSSTSENSENSASRKDLRRKETTFAPSSRYLAEKSRLLQERLNVYTNSQDQRLTTIKNQRRFLPVSSYEKEILSALNDSEVVIVTALTGSGKTTQIPQMILDSFSKAGSGSTCNIICTQPRRISAISVANRIADERNEKLGQSVGYQVRFDRLLPEPNGSITICTLGMFLVLAKDIFGSSTDLAHPYAVISHIIIDEVHERSIETDMALHLVKQLIKIRRDSGNPLRVVLMSATMHADFYQDYFRDPQSGISPAIIDVPGKCFPVQRVFLEDQLPEITRSCAGDQNLSKVLPSSVAEYLKGGQLPEESVPPELFAMIIAQALQNYPNGHLLAFLPGISDIWKVRDCFEKPHLCLGMPLTDNRLYSIHVIHSSTGNSEQQEVFAPSNGVRRIILATNIAESSVTIPDVTCVVDSGQHKQILFSEESKSQGLESSWISKANVEQRAGRAGRQRAGTYVAAFSRTRYASLSDLPLSDISRVNLESICMNISKISNPGTSIESNLSTLIEPPSLNRAADALKRLHHLGALDEEKNITALGHLTLLLPLNVGVAKLLIYGVIFRCVGPALTLAAVLSNESPFRSGPEIKALVSQIRKSWSPKSYPSDVLASCHVFEEWQALYNSGSHYAQHSFTQDNMLVSSKLSQIKSTRSILLRYLKQSGLLSMVSRGSQTNEMSEIGIPPNLNSNQHNLPLVASLLAVANSSNLAWGHSLSPLVKVPNSKLKIKIPPHSVLGVTDGAKTSNFSKESRILSFDQLWINSEYSWVQNCTHLDVVTAVLFGSSSLLLTETGLKIDDWLLVKGEAHVARQIYELKHMIDSCLTHIFHTLWQGVSKPEKLNNKHLAESGDFFMELGKFLETLQLHISELESAANKND